MTLHITTITPKHIISVSDRLLATPTGYKEIDNDKYKHLILITDDANTVITFAGFAGLAGAKETTIDWLTKVASNTSREGHHNIRKHLTDIRRHADDYISKFKKSGINSSDLRLAIVVFGWVGTKEYGDVQYRCIIENCLEDPWVWSAKARPKFSLRETHYGDAKFRDGSYHQFLGQEQLGIKQVSLRNLLAEHARENDPKKIFKTSVKIIRAASSESSGSIGINCSGVRMSKGDSGIEILNDRDTSKYDIVMPNSVTSISKGLLVTLGNIKGTTKPKK